MTYLATAFAFQLKAGKCVRGRVVRCCLEGHREKLMTGAAVAVTRPFYATLVAALTE